MRQQAWALESSEWAWSGTESQLALYLREEGLLKTTLVETQINDGEMGGITLSEILL